MCPSGIPAAPRGGIPMAPRGARKAIGKAAGGARPADGVALRRPEKQNFTKAQKCSRNGSPWLENEF